MSAATEAGVTYLNGAVCTGSSPCTPGNITSDADGTVSTSNAIYFGPDFVTGTASATPLPGALPLFAGGLGVLGLLARRRKRKNATAIAAA